MKSQSIITPKLAKLLKGAGLILVILSANAVMFILILFMLFLATFNPMARRNTVTGEQIKEHLNSLIVTLEAEATNESI